MKMLDIYYMYPIALTEGKGSILKDTNGKEYLDFYSGHGVISIGHSHPEFVKTVTQQLNQLAFYTNAFENPLQNELAQLLGAMSGYDDYRLFLSNSGAEANENALKAASMITGREKILAVKGAFHGRSTGAVGVTDNPKIRAAFGSKLAVDFVAMNSLAELAGYLNTKEYAAFIIEGIQGVNGVWEASTEFWEQARQLCSSTGTLFIIDEVQSGYGRSGYFFAHQHHHVKADIVTIAKGMGNGFPVAGTIFSPSLQIAKGMLGTTFGGGHLACAAAISVLNTIKNEDLITNAGVQGGYLKCEIARLPQVKTIRGRGLLLGIEFNVSAKKVRQSLLDEFGIITGFSEPEIIRILPPLNISLADCEKLVNALNQILSR